MEGMYQPQSPMQPSQQPPMQVPPQQRPPMQMPPIMQPPLLQPPHHKTLLWIIIIVLALVIVFIGYAYYLGSTQPVPQGAVGQSSASDGVAEDAALEKDLQNVPVDTLDSELKDIDTTLSQ